MRTLKFVVFLLALALIAAALPVWAAPSAAATKTKTKTITWYLQPGVNPTKVAWKAIWPQDVAPKDAVWCQRDTYAYDTPERRKIVDALDDDGKLTLRSDGRPEDYQVYRAHKFLSPKACGTVVPPAPEPGARHKSETRDDCRLDIRVTTSYRSVQEPPTKSWTGTAWVWTPGSYRPWVQSGPETVAPLPAAVDCGVTEPVIERADRVTGPVCTDPEPSVTTTAWERMRHRIYDDATGRWVLAPWTDWYPSGTSSTRLATEAECPPTRPSPTPSPSLTPSAAPVPTPGLTSPPISGTAPTARPYAQPVVGASRKSAKQLPQLAETGAADALPWLASGGAALALAGLLLLAARRRSGR